MALSVFCVCESLDSDKRESSVSDPKSDMADTLFRHVETRGRGSREARRDARRAMNSPFDFPPQTSFFLFLLLYLY